MEDTTVTASGVMSFAQRLENDSAAFYKGLAERWPEHEEAFLHFAKECAKSKTLVARTYQETITDALEACFSFEGLDLKSFVADESLGMDASLADALSAAVGLEERASGFYIDVAGRSQSLLATIARAFSRAAKVRDKRKTELGELVQEVSQADWLMQSL